MIPQYYLGGCPWWPISSLILENLQADDKTCMGRNRIHTGHVSFKRRAALETAREVDKIGQKWPPNSLRRDTYCHSYWLIQGGFNLANQITALSPKCNKYWWNHFDSNTSVFLDDLHFPWSPGSAWWHQKIIHTRQIQQLCFWVSSSDHYNAILSITNCTSYLLFTSPIQMALRRGQLSTSEVCPLNFCGHLWYCYSQLISYDFLAS